MKNFEEFVKHIVTKWRTEKEILLKEGGQLGAPSSREVGDMAEKYIVSKIDNLATNYTSYIATGSQTPSDIYSVGRRNGYWHIMLLQVKSSKDKKSIYKLNDNEIMSLEILAKFVKSEIETGTILKDYKKKEIVISIGYAGVHSNQALNPIRHYLVDTEFYKLYRINSAKLDMYQVKNAVIRTHGL